MWMVASVTKAWSDEMQFGLETMILWMLDIGDGASIVKYNSFLDQFNSMSIIEKKLYYQLKLFYLIIFVDLDELSICFLHIE